MARLFSRLSSLLLVNDPSVSISAAMYPITYLAIALVFITCDAFAGSPAPHRGNDLASITRGHRGVTLDCFVASGGTAHLHNIRCVGDRKISEAEAAELYLALPPALQVTADVAAEARASCPLRQPPPNEGTHSANPLTSCNRR